MFLFDVEIDRLIKEKKIFFVFFDRIERFIRYENSIFKLGFMWVVVEI